MLVLSRKKDETIVMGDEITVTVLEVRGSVVKLGVSAPLHVAIRRGELSIDAPKTPAPSAADERVTFVIETVMK